jgi:hypothetical protein
MSLRATSTSIGGITEAIEEWQVPIGEQLVPTLVATKSQRELVGIKSGLCLNFKVPIKFFKVK